MATATLAPRHVAPSAGQTYRVIADLVTFKAVAADTGGAYSLFEDRSDPGQGTPAHLQRYEDETFFVLEGTYRFLVGDQTVDLAAGGYAFVPRGTVHAARNVGAGPVRLLAAFVPAGPERAMEAFAQAPPEERDRLARESGSEFVAPPEPPPGEG